MQANQNLNKFLKSFLDLPPGRAVLIKGPWGAGKTNFIKQFAKNREKAVKGSPKFIYITLNGIVSKEQIEDQIFQQVNPLFANKYIGLAGGLAGALMQAASRWKWKVDIKLEKFSLKKLLPNLHHATLIFDDLERCQIPLEEIFGYMNMRSEHDGYRVIVLGNEDQIIKLNHEKRYPEIKEKLIGRTFSIEPQAAAALEAFVHALPDKNAQAKQELLDNSELILKLFGEAGYQNLRSLHQVVNEFIPLYELLPEKAREEEGFVADMLTVLVVLTLEFSKGELKSDQIPSLATEAFQQYSSRRKDPEATAPLLDLEKKYTTFKFHEFFPGKGFWVSYFATGSVPADVVGECVDNCRYFFRENMDILVKLTHVSEMESDDELNETICLVENKFNIQEYTSPSAIRMVAGLFLFLAEEGFLKKSKEEVISWVKEKIDDLFEQGKIEREIKSFNPRDVYKNNIIPNYETDEFKDIKHHLERAQRRAVENSLPEFAHELMDLMRKNPRGFWDRLSFKESKDIDYRDLPILASIDPEDFSQLFFDTSNSEKEFIGYAIQDRYKIRPYDQGLSSELDWLKSVKNVLLGQKNRLTALQHYHVRRFTSHYLDEAIDNLEKDIQRARKSDSPSSND